LSQEAILQPAPYQARIRVSAHRLAATAARLRVLAAQVRVAADARCHGYATALAARRDGQAPLALAAGTW